MASDSQSLAALMLLSSVAISVVSNDIKGPFDVCERDTFNVSCPQREVILMTHAMYGRMSLGTCIKKNFENKNCDLDVLTVMDGFCSGLNHCSVRPIHPAFFDIKRCPEQSAYLQSSYKCLAVNGANAFCSQGQRIESNSGYLASSQRNSNGAGTSYCPWTIISEDNTPINFTLYKFVPFQSSPLSSSSSVCFEIGTIHDGDLSQGILSCGSDPRSKPIYLSKGGGQVRLHFKDDSFLNDLGNFVIHFNVIGCGDPNVPSGASFKRSDSTASITCDDQSASWEVKCERGKWIGEVGHCIREGEKSMFHWIKTNTSYSIGLLAIVTICCAVAIFIGGFCIYVTHFYIAKRYSQPNPNSNYEHTVDIYKLQTMQRLKRPPSIAAYERTTSLPTPPGTMRRNTDYQRMNPIDPDTVSHHSYVLYDHVPKPLPPIPIQENKHIYETPLRPDQQ